MTDASFGDVVLVKWKGKSFEGIFISKDDEKIVIKLSNGYNIGFSLKNVESISVVSKQKQKHSLNKKRSGNGKVSVISTGGTILSKVEYKTGAVYPSLSGEDIREEFPEVESISSIKTIDLLNLLSEDMHPNHWSVIAEEVYNEIKDGQEGIVVLHGTDTMHYTASAIAFAVQNLPVPVVFVGAQRSSDRPSSDNKMNFLNALFTSTLDVAESTIVMHATINDDFCYVHRGVKARKMHTSRRDAFKTVNGLPIAKVDFSHNMFEPLSDYVKRGEHSIKNISFKPKFSSNVGMLYIHPGIKPELVSSFLDYDGVVLIGTGLGHAPTNPMGDKLAKPILNEISQLVESGVVVAMTSQTIFGRINMNVYTAGRLLEDAGVIGNLLDMTPETAFVKLSWLIANFGKEKAKELFGKNMVGEISERTDVSF